MKMVDAANILYSILKVRKIERASLILKQEGLKIKRAYLKIERGGLKN